MLNSKLIFNPNYLMNLGLIEFEHLLDSYMNLGLIFYWIQNIIFIRSFCAFVLT